MDTLHYQAALAGAVLYDETSYGRIQMRGESSADLLHRLSTNDMKRLRPGQGLRTVLTTPIGRIIDLVTVYAGEEGLTLITGPNQGGAVFTHLRKNIFFNDKVTLAPLARSHSQFSLYGPQAPSLLERLGGVSLAKLALHGSLQVALAGSDVLVARALPIGGEGFRLLIPAEGAEAVQSALLEGGAVTLDDPTFDLLRIEQGYGAVGRELSQEYIPLETGLGDAISFTKGCYVGQEIIARMESRGRLAKILRGLKLTGANGDAVSADPMQLLESIALPSKLDADGKEAGDLTSAVVSPRFGLIGLAYVRTAFAEPGTRLHVAGGTVACEVVELPWTS